MEALSDLAEEWQLTLGEGSPRSREVYLRGVRQCAAWLGEAHAELAEPGEVTHRHIHDWQRALADLGRCPARATRTLIFGPWPVPRSAARQSCRASRRDVRRR